MAQTFSNISKFYPFLGSLNPQAITLGHLSGNSVPVFLDWSLYGGTGDQAVSFDLSSAPFVKALVAIKSVYIDNMGSSAAIYILFPDTGYTIVAQANSAGWFPVYTNQFKFFVFALGIDPTAIPKTKILIANLPIQASTDIELNQAISLWKASPVLARTGALNPQLGVPALGDQFTGAVLPLQTDGAAQTLFGTPLASGNFIYITSVYFTIQAYQAPGSGPAQNRLFFESTGSAGIFFEEDIFLPQSQFAPLMPILSIQGQWKLDASQTYRVRNQVLLGPGSGAWNANFSYTISNE